MPSTLSEIKKNCPSIQCLKSAMTPFEAEAYEIGRRKLFRDVMGDVPMSYPETLIFKKLEDESSVNRFHSADEFFIGLKFYIMRLWAMPETVSVKAFAENTYDLIEELFERYTEWRGKLEVCRKNCEGEGAGEAEND